MLIDKEQVLSMIERYNTALQLLDDYDHQTMKRPKGRKSCQFIVFGYKKPRFF